MSRRGRTMLARYEENARVAYLESLAAPRRAVSPLERPIGPVWAALGRSCAHPLLAANNGPIDAADPTRARPCSSARTIRRRATMTSPGRALIIRPVGVVARKSRSVQNKELSKQARQRTPVFPAALTSSRKTGKTPGDHQLRKQKGKRAHPAAPMFPVTGRSVGHSKRTVRCSPRLSIRRRGTRALGARLKAAPGQAIHLRHLHMSGRRSTGAQCQGPRRRHSSRCAHGPGEVRPLRVTSALRAPARKAPASTRPRSEWALFLLLLFFSLPFFFYCVGFRHRVSIKRTKRSSLLRTGFSRLRFDSTSRTLLVAITKKTKTKNKTKKQICLYRL